MSRGACSSTLTQASWVTSSASSGSRTSRRAKRRSQRTSLSSSSAVRAGCSFMLVLGEGNGSRTVPVTGNGESGGSPSGVVGAEDGRAVDRALEVAGLDREVVRVREEGVLPGLALEIDREEAVDRVRARGLQDLRDREVVAEAPSVGGEERRHRGAVLGVGGVVRDGEADHEFVCHLEGG